MIEIMFKTYLALTLLIPSYTLLKSNFQIKPPEVSEEESQLKLRSDFVKLFDIGQKRLISSVTWFQTLLMSDLEHYRGADHSWLYHRFNFISDIDPYFLENYIFGGFYLSVVKDDIDGSIKILNKGLSPYPHSESLHYGLGFNYMFEKKDTKLALNHYRELLKTNRYQKLMPHLPSLLSKLEAKSGNYDLESSFLFLRRYYLNEKNEVLKKRYENTLYGLRAQIDLDCLNNNRGNCREDDLYGKPYLKNEGKFNAPRPYKPFLIHENNKKRQE